MARAVIVPASSPINLSMLHEMKLTFCHNWVSQSIVIRHSPALSIDCLNAARPNAQPSLQFCKLATSCSDDASWHPCCRALQHAQQALLLANQYISHLFICSTVSWGQQPHIVCTAMAAVLRNLKQRTLLVLTCTTPRQMLLGRPSISASSAVACETSCTACSRVNPPVAPNKASTWASTLSASSDSYFLYCAR